MAPPSYFKRPEENSLDWPPSYGLSHSDHDLFMRVCRTLCIEPAFLLLVLSDVIMGRIEGKPPELDSILDSMLAEVRAAAASEPPHGAAS